MRDLICDVISHFARSCDFGTGSVNDNTLFEKVKKEKRWEYEEISTQISI